MLIESSILVYKKLGYSHFIYIKTPDNLSINCFTRIKLCGFGKDYGDVVNFSALVRANKLPEPLGDKGVLHRDE